MSSKIGTDGRGHKWSHVRKKVAVIAGEGHRQKENDSNQTRNQNVQAHHATEQEALKVLNMLQKSEFFQTLPERSRKQLITEARQRKEGRIFALDELTAKEKLEKTDDLNIYEEGTIEEQKQRNKEYEDNRLSVLQKHRSQRMNWTLLGLFHGTILANLTICLIERLTLFYAF